MKAIQVFKLDEDHVYIPIWLNSNLNSVPPLPFTTEFTFQYG